jgi:hypothetical protein
MNTTDLDTLRIKALAAFLNEDEDQLSVSRHDDTTIEYGRAEYRVLTDSEADDAAREYIRESIWAFNATFILSECELPSELEEGIQAMQEKQCEDANDALYALVEKCCPGGIKAFAEAAISADGRGHFLSQYDGEENEEAVEHDGERETFYIYRTN